jgi:hypothetical protein
MAENSIHPVARRLWWPEAFVDEVMPAGRATPSAWLTRLKDGAHAIAGDDDCELDPIRLSEGAEIAFLQQDTLGRSRLTFEDDGKVTWSPTPPTECNFLWDGEVEGTTADDPDEFVEFLREAGIGEPGEWLIVYLMHIGARNLRCRFTALDGAPRFVALDTVPGAPADAVQAPPLDDAQGDLPLAAEHETAGEV